MFVKECTTHKGAADMVCHRGCIIKYFNAEAWHDKNNMLTTLIELEGRFMK